MTSLQTNITLNDEKLKTFAVRFRTRQKSQDLLNTIVEVLARVIIKQK